MAVGRKDSCHTCPGMLGPRDSSPILAFLLQTVSSSLCSQLQLLGQQLPRLSLPPNFFLPSGSFFYLLLPVFLGQPAPLLLKFSLFPTHLFTPSCVGLVLLSWFGAPPSTQSLRPDPQFPSNTPITQLPEETQGFPHWVVRLPFRLCPHPGHPAESTWKFLPWLMFIEQLDITT